MNFSTTRNCSSAMRASLAQQHQHSHNHNHPNIQQSMLSSSVSSSSACPVGKIKYIYELPFFERKEICRIFDENNQWETLGGGLMGYSSSDLSEFSRAVFRGGSPTDALLTSWGNQNHTILELFTLLGRLLHYRGMKILAKYVDPKYHTFIRDPDFHPTQELVGIDEPPAPTTPVEVKVQNITPEKVDAAEPPKKADGIPENEKGKLATLSESVGQLPQIPYTDLVTATNNWERRNILGKGGFGTVYKGMWKCTAVAIKRMEQRPNQAYVESQMKQSLGELKFLNSYRHDNILPLYGFSLEGDHPCLVYQFMNNGSLEDRILCRQRTTPLSWHLRFHISKGVACGIQFLHSIGPQPLIHGDIKSANILLDRNFEAKVGDFGLAREMTPPTKADASYVKVSRVHGTRPYLPDEYLRSKKLSTKVDTFSFGIVLFELATGQRAYEESRAKKFLRDLVEEAEGNIESTKDPKGGLDNPDVFFILMKLGRNCIERLPKNRPEMVQVLKSLETSMPQSTASSIRTISTHVTGLPYLFESPFLSRPASLLIPAGTSAMNRLSPEMRAMSPYWMPQQGTHYGVGATNQNNNGQNYTGQRPSWDITAPPSPLIRRSPQPSPPLPGPSPHHPYPGYSIPQSTPLPSPILTPTYAPVNINLHQDLQAVASSSSNNPPNQSINPGARNYTYNNQPSTFPNPVMNQLNINTGNTTTSSNASSTSATPARHPAPLPEVIMTQPSPTPLVTSSPTNSQDGGSYHQNSPNIVQTPKKTGPTVIETDSNKPPTDYTEDDMYLPLVLEHASSSASGGGNTNLSKSDFPVDSYAYDGDGPATCIPLITELGFKDD